MVVVQDQTPARVVERAAEATVEVRAVEVRAEEKEDAGEGWPEAWLRGELF